MIIIGLRVATPFGKRPSLELHISTDASFLKMVEPNNIFLCVGPGYCSLHRVLLEFRTRGSRVD